MAKMTLTPSQKIVEKNALKKEVTDDKGRLITLRRPDALDEFDLTSAMGSESTNMGAVAIASALLYVAAIDGENFIMPRSYEQVRAGIKRLGREGIKAVMDAMQASAELQSTEQEQLADIKK